MFEVSSLHLGLYVMGAVAALLLIPLALGAWTIGEQEAGLVIKRFGKALPDGRLLALHGEAGFQARLLPPGWHFFPWRWQYKVVRVRNLVVAPGEIALVVAADGATTPAGRILGREVPCDDFQDAEAFLRAGGERGRQLGFLRAGTYRINPALFGDHPRVRPSGTAWKRACCACVTLPRTASALSRRSTACRLTAAMSQGRWCSGTTASSAVRPSSMRRSPRLARTGAAVRSLEPKPWFVFVEESAMTEVPIGYVGVVVSYVGSPHLDVGCGLQARRPRQNRAKGRVGRAAAPGKHPINSRIMKVELVPTINIVLNWAARSEAHQYDDRLSSILVRSKDGFSFAIDVSQIIHISAQEAPRVISRVGSVQNLVDHVLQPIVGNYFRNSAQECSVLDFFVGAQRAAAHGLPGDQGRLGGLRCRVHRYPDRRHRPAG